MAREVRQNNWKILSLFIYFISFIFSNLEYLFRLLFILKLCQKLNCLMIKKEFEYIVFTNELSIQINLSIKITVFVVLF